MKTRTLRSVLFATLIFCLFCVFLLHSSDVRSEPKHDKFLIQTTIFEKDGDTKTFLKTINGLVYYGMPVEYYDKALAMKLVYDWPVDLRKIKGTPFFDLAKFGFRVQAKSTNIYFAPGEGAGHSGYYEERNNPYGILKAIQQTTLGHSSVHHMILDHVGIFNFNDPEKYYRVYEIHIKIKKLKAEK